MTPDRIPLQTRETLLVLYDPHRMKHRVRSPRSWWDHVRDGDYALLDDVREERIAFFPLGGKGGDYAVRVRQGDLTDVERPLSKGSVGAVALATESGHLFVGPGERVPGEGFGDRIVELEGGGALLPCEPGRWSVTVHVLDWKNDARWFDEENEPRPDAPSDFVVLLAKLDAAAPAPALPRPLPQLLSFLPKPKAPPASSSTGPFGPRFAAARARVEVGRPAALRGSGARRKREDAEWRPAPDPPPPPKPGEIRVGSRVRHAAHGEGTVLFIRDGFPKVKVSFGGTEVKVDRSEIVEA